MTQAHFWTTRKGTRGRLAKTIPNKNVPVWVSGLESMWQWAWPAGERLAHTGSRGQAHLGLTPHRSSLVS